MSTKPGEQLDVSPCISFPNAEKGDKKLKVLRISYVYASLQPGFGGAADRLHLIHHHLVVFAENVTLLGHEKVGRSEFFGGVVGVHALLLEHCRVKGHWRGTAAQEGGVDAEHGRFLGDYSVMP